MKQTLSFPITKSVSPDLIKKGSLLFSGNVSFLKGVVNIQGLPEDNRIEICFAGRSNAGKSSLINALTNQKSLARTSGTPGRTQEINFFNVEKTHYLVDLPGYGFASAPIKKVTKWQELVKSYLARRVSLRRVFLLIDSRHGIKTTDREIIRIMNSYAVTFQIVMTKRDKSKIENFSKTIADIQTELNKHPSAFPEILVTSSVNKEGIDLLRATIAKIS